MSSNEWRIRVITYNVALKGALYDTAKQIVYANKCDEEMMIIGLQEVPHSEQYVGADPSWITNIVKAIADNTPYSLIGKTFQATNLLLIFVRRRHAPQIGRIEYRYARNTLGGLTGHKGSIGVIITLANKESIVFTLSHFVHDASQLDARIAQYKGNRSCSFPERKKVRASFWLGDLNFRIEGEQNEIKEKIDKGDLNDLLDKDQLLCSRRSGKIFTDYHEAPITFNPTYRFFMGTTDYDLKRTPSWCDRILYKGNVSCKEYSSMDTVFGSDHIPVKGIYSISFGSLSNTPWRIQFVHIPTWYTSLPLPIRYRYTNDEYWNRRGSFTDWIGIFPSRAVDLTNPIKWVFAMTCYTDGSSPPHNVAEFDSITIGEYRIGYHSVYYNTIIGLSPPFKVIDPLQLSTK